MTTIINVRLATLLLAVSLTGCGPSLVDTAQKYCAAQRYSNEGTKMRELTALDPAAAEEIRDKAEAYCLNSFLSAFSSPAAPSSIIVQAPQPSVIVQAPQPNVVYVPQDTRWGDLGSALGGLAR